MKVLVLVFLMLLTVKSAWAEMAYLWIRPVETNKEHNYPAYLWSNGTKLNQAFRHSVPQKHPVKNSLEARHLNPSGSVTSIRAVYSDPGFEHKCKFKFKVFLSLESNFDSAVEIKEYLAPSDKNLELPLGLKCNGHTGSICSTNSNIQKKIVRLRVKKRVADYNRWKKQYDQRMKAKSAEVAQAEQQAQEKLADQKHSEPEEENAPEDPLAAYEEADFEENQEQEQAQQEELSGEDLVEDLAAEVEEQARQALIVEKKRQLARELEQEGGAIGGAIAMWINLDMDLWDFSVMVDEELAEIRKAEVEAISQKNHESLEQLKIARYQLEKQKRVIDSTRSDLVHLRGPVNIGKAAVRVIMNDAVDMAELTTGREMGLPNGRVLDDGERVLAALGVVFATRLAWEKVLDFVKRVGEKGKEGLKDFVSSAKKWDNVSSLLHVVKGNYSLAADGTRKIVSGMHTKIGFDNFLELNIKAGKNYKIKNVSVFTNEKLKAGSEILSQTLDNGVKRVQLPRDAWKNAGAFRAASAYSDSGQKLKGIKTLWPESYDVQKIGDVTKKIVENNPSIRNSIIKETVDGIKINVRVDELGKVVTSYPAWKQK